MPLFKDVETLLIVERAFEYNVEALEKKIIKIDDTALAAIIKLAPNNIAINEQEGPIKNLWPIKGNNSVILLKDLDDYLAINALQYKKKKLIEPSNELKPLIIPPVKETVPINKSINSDISSYKLLRDSQAATHIFKSPNLR